MQSLKINYYSMFINCYKHVYYFIYSIIGNNNRFYQYLSFHSPHLYDNSLSIVKYNSINGTLFFKTEFIIYKFKDVNYDK